MQVGTSLRQNLPAPRLATTPVHDRTADKGPRKITLASVNTDGGQEMRGSRPLRQAAVSWNWITSNLERSSVTSVRER